MFNGMTYEIKGTGYVFQKNDQYFN